MKKFLLTGEVAHRLKVNPVTLRRWCEDKKIKFKTNSYGWRMFDENEVTAIQANREARVNGRLNGKLK